MLSINAYAAISPTEPLVKTTITRRDLDHHDVLIRLVYAGVCHSDIHNVPADTDDSFQLTSEPSTEARPPSSSKDIQ
jgi:D-arabinose 1-dehydrogenase-like Zn-dependent alcohol dehydrogenase